MVGIKDVARVAGVSISTVSNVLNGRTDQMSDKTLKKIEQSIKELQYHPNRIAQQLKSGMVKMVGILVPSIMNPSYAALVNELECIAREKYGYQVMLGNTNRQFNHERQFLEDLRSFGIKGAIVVSSQIESKHFISALNSGMHLINYDGPLLSDLSRQMLVDSISMDNFKAGAMAAEHLLESGCKDLVFVTVKGGTASRKDKAAGFLSVLKKAGISSENRIIENSLYTNFGDKELADLGRNTVRLLMAKDRMPDGIVAINDMLALGLMSELNGNGIKIPDDVSIIGIDNIIFDTLSAPQLTSIAAPFKDMTSMMMDRLIKRINGEQLEPEEFLFEPQLLRRNSVRLKR